MELGPSPYGPAETWAGPWAARVEPWAVRRRTVQWCRCALWSVSVHSTVVAQGGPGTHGLIIAVWGLLLQTRSEQAGDLLWWPQGVARDMTSEDRCGQSRRWVSEGEGVGGAFQGEAVTCPGRTGRAHRPEPRKGRDLPKASPRSTGQCPTPALLPHPLRWRSGSGLGGGARPPHSEPRQA